MEEIRCKRCKRLLCKLKPGGEIRETAMKCPKCGHFNLLREVKYSPNYESRAGVTQ